MSPFVNFSSLREHFESIFGCCLSPFGNFSTVYGHLVAFWSFLTLFLHVSSLCGHFVSILVICVFVDVFQQGIISALHIGPSACDWRARSVFHPWCGPTQSEEYKAVIISIVVSLLDQECKYKSLELLYKSFSFTQTLNKTTVWVCVRQEDNVLTNILLQAVILGFVFLCVKENVRKQWPWFVSLTRLHSVVHQSVYVCEKKP